MCGERKGKRMEIKTKKTKYKIQFGYKAVAKSGIIKKALNIEGLADDDDYGEMIETMLNVVAEMVLAGLQRTTTALNVNYDDKNDVREKTEKVYAILDEYMDQEDSLTVEELFQELMNELFEAGFFGKKSQRMEEIAQQTDATVIPKDHLS